MAVSRQWLKDQDPSLPIHWLRVLPVPLAIAEPTGHFVWVNPEFEKLFGYSYTELTEPFRNITWKTLTDDPEDAKADESEFSALVSGSIDSYVLRRSCRPKNSRPILFTVYAQRYPITSDIFCILYTVTTGSESSGSERSLHDINTQLIKIDRAIELLAVPRAWIAFKELGFIVAQWSKANPTTAMMIFLFLSTMLLGERAITTFQMVKSLFSTTPPVPN